MKRHVVLPARGVLIVNTDVHGNARDFERVEAIFRAERTMEPETHWVILLGNHDHGHCGGPHTHRFYPDEVTALESTLSEAQRARLHRLCESALLAVAAPCGVLMTHGSPDTSLESLADLDDVPLAVAEMTPAQARMMRARLTSYGQPDHVCIPMLASVSRAAQIDLRVVVHGHDRDEKGFFHEGSHQVCPVIFGAAHPNKRYLRLDLGAKYEIAAEVREDFEILRLHEPVFELT